ncbi:hypothetical protein MKZ38_008042 [Zalerion maritima]|uniref:Phospholipase D/nuclease n=1 Tax=Zalerion maritima TaxID=339359 RepID=A0AAD5RHX2_9PEZI|nr:hypothetical protein MKZ38_008042 [Zalerion maritima]
MSDSHPRQDEPFEGDEDAQLAYAISLSLKDAEQGSQEPVVISSSDDDENSDDLDQPIGRGRSKQPTATPTRSVAGRKNWKALASKPAAAPSGMGGLPALDRKKMEEERLARLGKRSAPDSEVESQGRQQRLKQDSVVINGGGSAVSLISRASGSASVPPLQTPPIPKTLSRFNPATGSDGMKPKPEVQNLQHQKGLAYPKGVVKRTWVKGRPRTGDDIMIEEVLQKDDLQLAVLSSFQWDELYLLSKIRKERTKVILVAYAADEATSLGGVKERAREAELRGPLKSTTQVTDQPNHTQKQQMVENAPTNLIRFCFPPMHGPGSMHSKLQLLKFSQHMRIAVPTGNLMPYDWGETGHQENAVFLIDIPKKSREEKGRPSQLPPFAEDLFYFLRALGLSEALVSSLEEGYDFSETSRYGFVHTIAGSHKADGQWQRTGYCGLGRVVKSLGLATNNPVEIDLMAASLGSIKTDFLTSLYNAAQGDSGIKELESRHSRKSRKPSATKAASVSTGGDQMSLLEKRFRIYFPSHRTISRSASGLAVGATRLFILTIHRTEIAGLLLPVLQSEASGGLQHRSTHILGAGTICFRREWWNSPGFPRALLRDCKNARRPGVLMHTKMMFVRPQQHEEKLVGETEEKNRATSPDRREARALAKWLSADRGGGRTETGARHDHQGRFGDLEGGNIVGSSAEVSDGSKKQQQEQHKEDQKQQDARGHPNGPSGALRAPDEAVTTNNGEHHDSLPGADSGTGGGSDGNDTGFTGSDGNAKAKNTSSVTPVSTAACHWQSGGEGKPSVDEAVRRPWVYVGSANLSESAW